MLKLLVFAWGFFLTSNESRTRETADRYVATVEMRAPFVLGVSSYETAHRRRHLFNSTYLAWKGVGQSIITSYEYNSTTVQQYNWRKHSTRELWGREDNLADSMKFWNKLRAGKVILNEYVECYFVLLPLSLVWETVLNTDRIWSVDQIFSSISSI